MRSLRQYLSAFARALEERPVNRIGLPELEAWFGGRQEASSAEASNRGRLSAFFGFAVRRGWIAGNPVSLLEPIHIHRQEPEVLTVDECRKALDWTRDYAPRCLGLLVVLLFLGLRPQEARRLGAEAFRDGAVVVDSAASKIHRRRIVPVNATAAAWLAVAGPWRPVGASSARRWLRRLREAIGRAAWPQDVLRHSYISYALATGQPVHQVAELAGNSPGIIGRHYRALVTREEAARFWGIRPAHQLL
jgi:site-specific recombinase XerD